MSALPKPMPVAEIEREHQQAPDMRTPFFALVERLRNSDRCDLCGKTRVLLRLSAPYQREAQERPDPAYHCACPGGPAHVPAAMRVGATIIARYQLVYYESRTQRPRYIAGGTRGVIRQIEDRIAFLAFEGHEQIYLQTATRVTVIADIIDTPDATEGGRD